jgi:hypothetical protein
MHFEHRGRARLLNALAMGVALSACGAPARETAVESPMVGVEAPKEELRTPRAAASLDELEARYARAGDAQTAYEDCVRRFTPDYDEQMRIYGEINLGAEGGWISPAVDGCADEKRTLDSALAIAEGRPMED